MVCVFQSMSKCFFLYLSMWIISVTPVLNLHAYVPRMLFSFLLRVNGNELYSSVALYVVVKMRNVCMQIYSFVSFPLMMTFIYLCISFCSIFNLVKFFLIFLIGTCIREGRDRDSFSPTMDAVIRIFKRVFGLYEIDDELLNNYVL